MWAKEPSVPIGKDGIVGADAQPHLSLKSWRLQGWGLTCCCLNCEFSMISLESESYIGARKWGKGSHNFALNYIRTVDALRLKSVAIANTYEEPLVMMTRKLAKFRMRCWRITFQLKIVYDFLCFEELEVNTYIYDWISEKRLEITRHTFSIPFEIYCKKCLFQAFPGLSWVWSFLTRVHVEPMVESPRDCVLRGIVFQLNL
jgi:hypothetical protein